MKRHCSPLWYQGFCFFMQLMERNPEFAQVLNNPQQLQEAMQAASNPVCTAAFSNDCFAAAAAGAA